MTERARPSIVRINTPNSAGSGTIIDSNGYILTNYHVVSGYSNVDVRVEDAYTVTGTVVGFDESKDIAIVRINAGSRLLRSLPLSNRRPQDGEEIITIGYPESYILSGGTTTTRGVVSATRNYFGQTLIQIDAPINPGNSGGAAIDREGRFIGIPTLKLIDADNIGFLVPGFDIAGQIQQLKGGYRFAFPTQTPFPTATPRPTSTPRPTPTPAPSAYDHFLQGDFYYTSGQYYLALSEYNSAIILSPGQNPAYYNNRGNVYYSLGFYREAVDDYTQAVQISGGADAIYYNNRAGAWFYLGMYTQMNIDDDIACRLDPKYC
jgi:hypothetical protein